MLYNGKEPHSLQNLSRWQICHKWFLWRALFVCEGCRSGAAGNCWISSCQGNSWGNASGCKEIVVNISSHLCRSCTLSVLTGSETTLKKFCVRMHSHCCFLCCFCILENRVISVNVVDYFSIVDAVQFHLSFRSLTLGWMMGRASGLACQKTPAAIQEVLPRHLA